MRGRDPTLGNFNFFESHFNGLRRPNSLQIELGRGFMYSLIENHLVFICTFVFFSCILLFSMKFYFVCVCLCVLCILKMIYPSHLEMKSILCY